MSQLDITQGVCTINNHLVSGWSDSSDCLAFPPDSEISAFKKGATGDMVSSRTGERGGAVTVKVLANSPTAAFMGKLIKQIDNNIPINFTLTWSNPVVGEFTSCTKGTLVNAPRGTTYGKGETGEKVYVFEFESITESPELALAVGAVSLVSAIL